MFTLDLLRAGYEQLFNTCAIKPARFAEIDNIADEITANQARYEGIGDPLNIPWYFIGILHALECNLDFERHLHNGDPLSARTVRVPAGQPKKGSPPFSFEDSAKDALLLKGFDLVTEWTVPGILFLFERYNGFGYRKKTIAIPSPYLWSFTNHYTKGKFVGDHKFDPDTVSKQPGTATILRRLAEKQVISFGDQELNKVKAIKKLGEQVNFAPTVVNEDARRLQQLLNEVGFPLLRDGKAGKNTSNAYKQVSGKFLSGDPRRSN